MTRPLLEVRGLSVNYGSVRALVEVSLGVNDGEIIAILGANGAGKSTLLDAITGVVPKAAGSVMFDGLDLTQTRPWRAVDAGIVQVPEGRQLFPNMSVEANLKVASREQRGDGWTAERVYELFPRLSERKGLAAGNLSGGEQQMVAIARALLAQPRVLLLDEPSLGLSPKLAHDVLERVRRLRDAGLAVVLVEQNAIMALEIADRGYVLATGSITVEASAAELLSSSAVRSAYLGSEVVKHSRRIEQ